MIHYAALDAYVQIMILEKLRKSPQAEGFDPVKAGIVEKISTVSVSKEKEQKVPEKGQAEGAFLFMKN
jgi:hypothetical protein